MVCARWFDVVVLMVWAFIPNATEGRLRFGFAKRAGTVAIASAWAEAELSV